MMRTVKARDGVFTCYDNDWIIKEVEACGAFSRPEIAMIRHFIRPGDTVLDVGAHIGTFSVPIKKAIGPDGRLFAFEANPDTYSLLEKNLRDNQLEAITFNQGVSDQEGTLYLRAKNLKGRSNGGSLEQPLNTGADYLTDRVVGNSDDFIKVPLVKIDDAVQGSVHFIKVDVEGMELSVLKSARQTIDRNCPIIYSEYFDYYLKRAGTPPDEYEKFLKERGYHFFMNARSRKAANDEFTLVRIPGPRYIRGQVDFLLIPAGSDRYPRQFLDWRFYKPHLFILNRVWNFLSPIKSRLKSVLHDMSKESRGIVDFLKKCVYGALRLIAKQPRVGAAFKNLCRYYIRYYDGYSYDMFENGEANIIKRVSENKKQEEKVFFDVGANKGDWSKIAVGVAPNAKIHCFEPSSDTFKTLCTELQPYQNIIKNNFALSNVHTRLRFNNYGHGSGRNSFVERPSFPHGPVERVEEIDTWTAKEYIEKSGLKKIDFMKIDVEGWEYFVLLGLEEYLNPDFVSVIQFEYGYAHGDNKTLMRDFYDLLGARGYRIGKLKKEGVKFTDFVYYLNDFESGPNFVACAPQYVSNLSDVSS